MAITVVSRGTRSISAPGVPAGNLANDVILMVIDCQTNTASATPTVTGFSLAGIGRSGGTTGRGIAFYWKRLSSTDSGTYAISFTGGVIAAAEAFALRGCITTGNPYGTPDIEGAITSSSSTVAVSLSGLTTTDLLIWAFATSGTAVTISSGATGWNEESATTSSVMHELSKTSTGTSIGPITLTMSAASNPRITGLINFIAAPPVVPSTSAAFLSLL